MFTGIITDMGELRRIETAGEMRLQINTKYDMATVDMGASICCSGVCLTVVDLGVDQGADQGADWFAVEVSAETLSNTTLGNWQAGSRINLERALKMGDELGGHIVSGHVDGVGKLTGLAPQGESIGMTFAVPSPLERFIAAKGSITVDGVSLTVNTVSGGQFTVNVIPHTLEVTTLGNLKPGDTVNLEIDMLARYVARLRETEN